jgi:hypothetical protein
MTLDYVLRLRSKKQHEVLAELLDFGLTHKAIRPEHRAVALEMLREVVTRLLMRKRLSEDDERRIRRLWGRYIA